METTPVKCVSYGGREYGVAESKLRKPGDEFISTMKREQSTARSFVVHVDSFYSAGDEDIYTFTFAGDRYPGVIHSYTTTGESSVWEPNPAITPAMIRSFGQHFGIPLVGGNVSSRGDALYRTFDATKGYSSPEKVYETWKGAIAQLNDNALQLSLLGKSVSERMYLSPADIKYVSTGQSSGDLTFIDFATAKDHALLKFRNNQLDLEEILTSFNWDIHHKVDMNPSKEWFKQVGVAQYLER